MLFCIPPADRARWPPQVRTPASRALLARCQRQEGSSQPHGTSRMLNHERPLETAMIRGEGRGFIPCSGGPSDSAYRNRLPVDRAPGGHRRDCSAKNSPAEYHDSHPPGAPGWRVRAKPGTCGPRGDVDHTRIVRRVRDRLVEWREWDEDKGCSLWGLGEKLAGRRTRPRRPQARRGDGQAHRQRTVPLGRALGHRRHPDALPCSRGPRGCRGHPQDRIGLSHLGTSLSLPSNQGDQTVVASWTASTRSAISIRALPLPRRPGTPVLHGFYAAYRAEFGRPPSDVIARTTPFPHTAREAP